MTMDAVDRKLLGVMQDRFPVSSRPYLELGGEVGLDEAGALRRVRRLREDGFFHRIGASFDSKKLGHASTLVGMKVAAGHVESAAAAVGRHPEVTHCYERDDEYNLWFTVIAPSGEELEGILQQVRQETGVKDMLDLPATRVFKIRVHFELEDGCPALDCVQREGD